MKNRDVYQRDPFEIALLNNGVATVTDALTGDERRTLRFELTHFVCEGQYRSGLVRILESYVRHQGQPEQPAAWISGFFGSGKSHLAKMLRFLWTDYAFPEDGARARGLARLPDDVLDLFTEASTLGRRGHGLHAAAGTLGAGTGDSVRLALLGIVFKSAGLPESFPQARFCLWLRKNGIYEQVRDTVATARRESRPGSATAPGAGRAHAIELVADVTGGARVLQGGGNERLEAALSAKVKEAAGASLARLYPEFGDADDSRWPTAIERARRGAGHPLEALDYQGRTEEHPVCAAVLAFVGSGRKGREVRTHFSAPPCGWPRDAVDAALIALFAAGHLRAVVNGVALRPPQLDQAKVPNTDFRVESVTIDARQRLKLRKLFQNAGIDCRPNEEAAAAGRLLARLHELAQDAGGDPRRCRNAPIPAISRTFRRSPATSSSRGSSITTTRWPRTSRSGAKRAP